MGDKSQSRFVSAYFSCKQLTIITSEHAGLAYLDVSALIVHQDSKPDSSSMVDTLGPSAPGIVQGIVMLPT